MCTKETSHKNPPTNSLERILMPKHVFNLKCLILNFIFICLEIEKIVFSWLVVFNVLSTEFVDGSDILQVLSSSVIETFRSGSLKILLIALNCHVCQRRLLTNW